MEMTPEKWERVKVLFEAALDKPTEQRITYLADVCAEEDVREQVSRLLADLESAGTFLNKPALSGLDLAAPSRTADRLPMVNKTSIAASESSPLIGQTLSHYRVVAQIGAGGMGVVYRAYDEQLDRNVALKVLPSGLLADEDARKRFRKEALALAKLNHPNIETIFEFGSQDGIDFLAMELIPGEPLNEKLRGGPLSERDLMRFGVQLTEGLAAAHEQGVIHTDLKPANIFITPDNRVKILDFGLARLLKTGEDENITKTITSQGGGIAGTLPYMAPEQLRAEPLDARSDIYAAGTVMYEMATGRRPFAQNQAIQLIGEILHTQPPPPSSINQHLQPGLEAVILKALDKSPSERYQTAREFRIALETLTAHGFATSRLAAEYGVQATKSTGSSPAAVATASVPRWNAYAMGMILILGVLTAVWVIRHERAPKSPPKEAILRPRLAVIGFRNLSNRPEANWISSPLSEMMAHEMEEGDHLLAMPGEDVAVAKKDLGLREDTDFGEDTIRRIHQRLHCDYILYGSFYAPGPAAGGNVKVMMRVQDARTGDTVASVSDEGTEAKLDDLTERLGTELREKLQIPSISPSESEEIQASIPASKSRQSFYQGLERLRDFDFLAARDLLQKASESDPNFALAHAYLAQAWSELGYDGRARDEAQKSFELSKHLPREEQRLVEARYREMAAQWDKAGEIYHSLWTIYPEKPEYALNAVDVLIRGGHSTEALKMVQTLRQQGGTIAKDPRLDLKQAEGEGSLGDWTKDKEDASQAAAEAQQRGWRLLQAEALWRDCEARFNLGDASGAVSSCKQSAQIAEPLNDMKLVKRDLTMLGRVAGAQGNLDQALASHREALASVTKIGSRGDMVGALMNIGDVLSSQGNHSAAQESYREGMALAREIDDRSLVEGLLNDLAVENQITGNFSEAIELYQQSLDTARAIQDKPGIAKALGNTGSIYFLQGKLSEAKKNLEEAIRISEQLGLKSDLIQYVFALGDTQFAQGHLASAESNYQNGKNLAAEIGEKPSIAEAQLSLGSLRSWQQKPEEALGLGQAAAAEFHADGMKDQESQSRNLVASSLLDLNRTSDAAKEMELISALSPKDPTIRLSVATTKARIESRTARLPEGRKDLETIVLEAKRMGVPGIELDARLALGEIGLYGGDKGTALSVLGKLEQDASRRGYKQYEARAKEIADKITAAKST